ncbi:IS3 family transposase [Actinomadura sp. DC4]|uniref:IS3 family transposase n=1 Tax=Actinomadura sp. DC4 TaxID=3055069 RepID=UPI0025B228F9|nr:IS3 family transposase [Actinomadura sp. DC4]MDN3360192.1 IS3 family transposase [Actinomadura sp. DC4]
MAAKSPYSPELRRRAVRMVGEVRPQYPTEWAAITAVAEKLGIGTAETLRTWVRRAEADDRPAGNSSESEEVKRLKRENAELRRANEILKAASAYFRPGARCETAALVEFVDAHRDRFGVEPVCAALEFAPSTYYAAKKRERFPSGRSVRDEVLKMEIERVWEKPGRKVYGARKVWQQLNREGIVVARCTVERLMGELGIAGVCAQSKRPRTTLPAEFGDMPSDLLERGFDTAAPNHAWVADITYVPTEAGWVYTAFVLDLFSRRIVGWQVADHLRADLALDALEMAIWSRRERIGDKLVHHSDRGVQYTAIRYADRLDEIGAVRSVGSKGDSYDNAAAESLNSLYKRELIDFRGSWEGVMDVTIATMEWVAWYNSERLHSYCGGIPPKEFEESFYKSQESTKITSRIQAI